MNDPWRTRYVTDRRWEEVTIHACLIAHDGNADAVTDLLGVNRSTVAAVLAETQPAASPEPTAIAQRVLAEWIAATGRDATRTKLNSKRLSAIRARLREGYTENDLIAAARGIGLSAFHRGDNPEGKRYDDLLVAIRDGERVEKFREIGRAHV